MHVLLGWRKDSSLGKAMLYKALLIFVDSIETQDMYCGNSYLLSSCYCGDNYALYCRNRKILFGSLVFNDNMSSKARASAPLERYVFP